MSHCWPTGSGCRGPRDRIARLSRSVQPRRSGWNRGRRISQSRISRCRVRQRPSASSASSGAASVSADYVNAKGRKLTRLVESNPLTPPNNTRRDPTRIGGMLSRAATATTRCSSARRSIAPRDRGARVRSRRTDDDGRGERRGLSDDLAPNAPTGMARRINVTGCPPRRGHAAVELQAGAILATRSGAVQHHHGPRQAGTLFTDRPIRARRARQYTADMLNRASFVDRARGPASPAQRRPRTDAGRSSASGKQAAGRSGTSGARGVQR
jgi:hypothetical protein